jgi:uncharacterized membrane protein
MIAKLTFVGTIHMMLAMLCIMVGAIQLMRPKHGAAHRARGYAFVYAMAVVDGLAMLLYRVTGSFNAFHVGAIVNLAAIVAAMVPMLMSPRPANWKHLHYRFMSWGFVGLMAAAVTGVIVRMVRLTHEQSWAVSGGATALVMAIGYAMIERFRPRSEVPPKETANVQHEGAT